MSKIQELLAAATELAPSKRNNETITDQAYMKRLALGIQDLPDADYDKLPKEAIDWFNSAADAIEKKQDIPAFPDMEQAEGGGRRRRAAAAEPFKAEDAKKGDKITLKTKRGVEYVGVEVLDTYEGGLVIDDRGREKEIDLEVIAEIARASDGGSAGGDEPKELVLEVGATVKVITARGKEVLMVVTELTDDEIVGKDAAGDPQEFTRDKLKSVTVTLPPGGGTTSRRAASSTGGEGTKAGAAGEPAKQGRVTAASNGGVSVTTRIRELIAENFEFTKDQVGAVLKKEGLDFKQNTLDLTFGDMHKIIGILRTAGRLK